MGTLIRLEASVLLGIVILPLINTTSRGAGVIKLQNPSPMQLTVKWDIVVSY